MNKKELEKLAIDISIKKLIANNNQCFTLDNYYDNLLEFINFLLLQKEL